LKHSYFERYVTLSFQTYVDDIPDDQVSMVLCVYGSNQLSGYDTLNGIETGK